jgi:hypothetical protein
LSEDPEMPPPDPSQVSNYNNLDYENGMAVPPSEPWSKAKYDAFFQLGAHLADTDFGSPDRLDVSRASESSPSFANYLSREAEYSTGSQKRFKVNIVIISNNRLAPLKRLCRSLMASHAHSRLEMSLTFNLEASSSHDLVDFAEKFKWTRGYKTVRKRILQGGLIRAVSEAWYPSSSDEYGLFLEDDIEVSPFFTDWIVYAMDMSDMHPDPRLVGISLYTPRITETYFVNGSKPRFDGNALSAERFKEDRQVPLLMQTPCSWGALYFPLPWRDFLSYLQSRITSETLFEIEGSRTNGWKASWKRYLFEYLWAKGCYLLYPNFEDQRSFSTNHMEGGAHIGTKENAEAGNKKVDFVVPLFGSTKWDGHTWELFSFRPKMSLGELPVLDLFNRPFNSKKDLERQLRDLQKDWAMVPTSVKDMPPPSLVYDFLSEGQTLWTTPTEKERLRTQTGTKDDDFIYQGLLRRDGDFVIYAQKFKHADDGFGKRVFDTSVDAFDTSKSNTLNYYNYSLTLRTDGMLVLYAHPYKGPPCNENRCDSLHEEVYCLAGNSGKLCKGFGKEKYCSVSPRCKGEKRTKFLLWSSPQGEPKPKKNYVAEIDQNGALVVHTGPLQCGVAAKDTLYRSSSHGKKACTLWPSNRELRCKNAHHYHSKTIQSKLSDRSSITILISTYDRFEILMKQIAYYSQSPSVSRIIVTWHNMLITPPKSTRIGHVLIHFLTQKEDSLNNRFNPSWQVATDAALIIDDDMKVHLEDIDLLFEVWKKSRMSIVGFAPRWIGNDKEGNLKYLEESEDPPWHTPEAPPKEGYAMMLTKVMMIHRDFLHHYSCGSSKLRKKVHRMVDLYRNCEDVGFNALVALSTNKKIGSGPALFVTPLHQLGDFGKSGTALHARSKHQAVRSTCLNMFKESFDEITSSKASAFPMQTTFIESTRVPGSKVVELREKPYQGHRKRLHVDCVVDPDTGVLRAVGRDGEISPIPEACAWGKEPVEFLDSLSFKWV